MRKLCTLLFLLITATNIASAQKYLVIHHSNGETTELNISDIDSINIETIERDTVKTLNNHVFVDLGLPSGLWWATCNVGAENAEDFGYYFAWGETSTKETFTLENYKYGVSIEDSLITKYNSTDDLTILEAEDDAATANWGEGVRMPTKEELVELQTNCTWTWDNPKKGYHVKSRVNGNEIFLPAAGSKKDGDVSNKGIDCYIWSSTRHATRTNYAHYLDGAKGYIFPESPYHRYYGRSVRPVAEIK